MSLARSTMTVALSTLASRILGFVREMLFARFFGASGATDAFFVAWRIPNLLRRLVAEGALTISFIPVYTEYRVQLGDDEARKLAQKTLSLLLLVLLSLVGLGELLSPWIVRLFAIGFEDHSILSLAVGLNRALFPYLFFVALVAFSMGILNSHDYFFAPAFAPVLLNIGFIAGILWLATYFDEPLYGVAVGVLAGGMMQLLFQIPWLRRSRFSFRFSLDPRHPGIQKIFRMLGPAVFGIAVYQINILVGTALASMLEPGSISWLYFSDRLTEMVLGVFIVSIGNVILPAMSRFSAADNLDELRRLYLQALRASLFIAAPAAAALAALALPVISILFMRGNFTPHDASMTARALLYASPGIVSVSFLRITTPTFYSLKDTRTPVLAATVALILNGVLGWILMHTSLAHAGLSLANVISVTVQVFLLLILLQRRTGKIDMLSLGRSIVKNGFLSLAVAYGMYHFSTGIDWYTEDIITRAGYLLLIGAAGVVVYFAGALLLRIEEAVYVVRRLRGGR